MTVWGIIRKEVAYDRAGFVVGLLCITVAIASLVGAVTLLRAHKLRTERIIAEKEAETRRQMERMEDDYRLIMRGMGYNVLVLHEDQQIGELRLHGSPTTYMPLDYVYRLATGQIETLNHLLPILQKRVTWPERDREIILCGVLGQVPNYSKPRHLTSEGVYRDPITHTIPDGTVDLGHDIALAEGLSQGESLRLFDADFTVNRVRRRQGNEDDMTIWCSLEKVQGWFGLEGKINGILALECLCALDAVGAVERDVSSILPDVQVLEMGTRVRTRAEARTRAAEAHQEAVTAELLYQAGLRGEREVLVRLLVPLVMLAAAVWIFFLILGNVRARQGEIAVMRTVGVTGGTIMFIFLAKAALMGLAGGGAGYFAGLAVGALWEGVPLWSTDFSSLFSAGLLGLVLVMAPALAVAAGWVPSVKAARMDPAVILSRE